MQLYSKIWCKIYTWCKNRARICLRIWFSEKDFYDGCRKRWFYTSKIETFNQRIYFAKFEIVDKKIPQKIFEIMKPAEGISLDIKGDINIEKNIEV